MIPPCPQDKTTQELQKTKQNKIPYFKQRVLIQNIRSLQISQKGSRSGLQVRVSRNESQRYNRICPPKILLLQPQIRIGCQKSITQAVDFQIYCCSFNLSLPPSHPLNVYKGLETRHLESAKSLPPCMQTDKAKSSRKMGSTSLLLSKSHGRISD